ncbi:hypothetical protein [Bradyrhizobium sp. DASA03120]|uniref:hypothetical protein n=1 Tax=Bradyrhizobium sp. SMVTL-02 TaxID=3395917 RepID=UPI003F72E195
MVRDRASSYVLGLAGISLQTARAALPSASSPGVVIQIVTRDPTPPVIDITTPVAQVITP